MPSRRKRWRTPISSRPMDCRKDQARNMATKKTPADKFRERLDGLSAAIPEDLRLPSLEENCLEGYAYLFRLVLPSLNAKGKRVFTDPKKVPVILSLNPIQSKKNSLRRRDFFGVQQAQW